MRQAAPAACPLPNYTVTGSARGNPPATPLALDPKHPAPIAPVSTQFRLKQSSFHPPKINPALPEFRPPKCSKSSFNKVSPVSRHLIQSWFVTGLGAGWWGVPSGLDGMWHGFPGRCRWAKLGRPLGAGAGIGSVSCVDLAANCRRNPGLTRLVQFPPHPELDPTKYRKTRPAPPSGKPLAFPDFSAHSATPREIPVGMD